MPTHPVLPTPEQQKVLDRIHAQRERVIKRRHAMRQARAALPSDSPARQVPGLSNPPSIDGRELAEAISLREQEQGYTFPASCRRTSAAW